MLNRKESPIQDQEVAYFLKKQRVEFRVALDCEDAYKESKFIVATPIDKVPKLIRLRLKA